MPTDQDQARDIYRRTQMAIHRNGHTPLKFRKRGKTVVPNLDLMFLTPFDGDSEPVVELLIILSERGCKWYQELATKYDWSVDVRTYEVIPIPPQNYNPMLGQACVDGLKCASYGMLQTVP